MAWGETDLVGDENDDGVDEENLEGSRRTEGGHGHDPKRPPTGSFPCATTAPVHGEVRRIEGNLPIRQIFGRREDPEI